MSAILSASDLNDFISPGVACIKPVESLPAPPPSNPYEVITEDSPSSRTAQKSAQISLTDCLACSGCVTSAEAVLVQLQSVQEVLDNLEMQPNGRKFVALVSPQSVASLAAVYGVSWPEARAMVEEGLRRKGFCAVVDTDWGRDICAAGASEEVQRMLTGEGKAEELKKPILTSACPGFVCYAEAVHPYLLPHLSRMKSPQALLGTFIKSVLPKFIAQERGVEGKCAGPEQVYVVGVQPCFDKKLEGARAELTNASWMEGVDRGREVRDVDCVITTRELVTLCGEETFGNLPRAMPDRRGGVAEMLEGMLRTLRGGEGEGEFRYTPVPISPSPSSIPSTTDFRDITPTTLPSKWPLTAGTSGGYLIYILCHLQSQHPGSTISIIQGRNSDIVEYTLLSPQNTEIIKLARSYGFRNIQNLVRKLKPRKRRVLPKFGRKGVDGQVVLEGVGTGEGTGYAYVEVMACPGGCTNGGGQVKVDDALEIGGGGGEASVRVGAAADAGQDGAIVGVGGQQKQRGWLAKVDEAYWSDDSPHSTSNNIDAMEIDGEQKQKNQHPFGIDPEKVKRFIDSWSQFTGVSVEKLLFTGYRKVEDEFIKDKPEEDPSKTAAMRAAELAGKAGGGW